MGQSRVSRQRVTDLLPAWYYNFRVSMVTWGEPPLSCCDSSAVTFVTGMTSGWEGLILVQTFPANETCVIKHS